MNSLTINQKLMTIVVIQIGFLFCAFTGKAAGDFSYCLAHLFIAVSLLHPTLFLGMQTLTRKCSIALLAMYFIFALMVKYKAALSTVPVSDFILNYTLVSGYILLAVSTAESRHVSG